VFVVVDSSSLSLTCRPNSIHGCRRMHARKCAQIFSGDFVIQRSRPV
jgi:hypothetical protein